MNTKRLLKHTLFLFLLLNFGTAYSQLFLSGEDPASLKWNQINTENFQVIFPLGCEKQAQYFANALEQAYEYGRTTLKVKPRKISVLLHTQSVVSNGTTAWAPARIDIYNTPPQDNYPVNWFAQLAVHEFRHVVQIERMNTGLTKIFSILLGQQAAAGVSGAYLPWWFIEGDAVVTETALSKSGRGRLLSFEMPLKAQLLEKGSYDYEKATHGSFKDFTPSPYHLGYQIVAYGRSKYGADFWDKTVENVARKPLFFNSFSSGIKKQSGLSKRQFYEKTMDFLAEKWSEIDSEIKMSDYKIITPRPKYFSSYINPVYLEDGSIIAFKTSMDDLTRIVKVNPAGDDEVLLTPGPTYLESLSSAGNLICWAELEPDLRWTQRNFSVIKLYNTQTKVLGNLTNKSRYHSPQLNPEGTRVAAIEVTDKNDYSLVILDLRGGVIYRYQSEDNAFLMHPTWSKDGKKMAMTVFTEEGKNLRILNLDNSSTKDVLDFSYAEISRPQIIGNRLFFIADYSGIDNIYAYDLNTEKITQISSVRFGVGNFTYNANEQKIIFPNYSSDGFALAEQPLNREKETPLSQIQNNSFTFVDDLVKQEKGIVEVKEDELKHYPVTKYSKASKLFNFHSWAPYSLDVDNYEFKPGFMLMSQNPLSTAITSLGYEYDMNEKFGKYFANFEYRGWYPIIDLNVEYGKERGIYQFVDTLDQMQTIPFTFKQMESSFGIRQPLNFSKNKYMSGLTPFVRIKNTYRKVDDEYDFDFIDNTFQSLEYGIVASFYLRSSLRDMYPQWGIISRIRYIHTPFVDLHKSDLFALEGILYMPGFMKHHGFRFYGAMQLRELGAYNPSNAVPFIRGMSRPPIEDLYRFSVDYKFPLFYPDWDLNSLLYIKRLTVDLFYDYAYGEFQEMGTHYNAFGAELQMQTHILSFLAPVNISYRVVYYPDLNDYSLNVFFNIDFSFLY